MSKAKNTVVSLVLVNLFDEFQGLYADGKLIAQDNGLDTGEQIVKLSKKNVKCTLETRNFPDSNEAAMAIYVMGCFPAKLSAINF